MATQSHEPMPFPPGEGGTLVEQPAEHDVFPPFDSSTFPSQLLWFALTFALLYYLMSKVALPRIAGILEDRRDRIASDLDLADPLLGDAELLGEVRLGGGTLRGGRLLNTVACALGDRVGADARLGE